MADIASVERLLAAERRRTERRLAALDRDFAAIVDEVAIGSTDDEHDPEGATTAFERAQIAALRDQARAYLGEIEAAERRLRDGSYGTCERCRQPIAAERLRARPTAARCIGCA